MKTHIGRFELKRLLGQGAQAQVWLAFDPRLEREVAIKLKGGTLIHAVLTNEAVLELGLAPGVAASALIKASHIVLGVRQ